MKPNSLFSRTIWSSRIRRLRSLFPSWVGLFALYALVGLALSCAGVRPGQAKDQVKDQVKDKNKAQAKIQRGDVALVSFTLMTKDGRVVATNLPDMADDSKVVWVPGIEVRAMPGPEPMQAGTPASVPGLAEKLPGLVLGQKHKVTLPPMETFGTWDPAEIRSFPRTRELRRTGEMPLARFEERFGKKAEPGQEVDYNEYVRARVVNVTETAVNLELFASRETADEPFGQVVTQVEGDRVVTTLNPRAGALFSLGSDQGVISGMSQEHFMVDFNHPLAGQELQAEVQILDLIPARSVPKELPWIEDEKTGSDRAEKLGKPQVVVLYSLECGACEKLFRETVTDPRIRALADRFAWTRLEMGGDIETQKRFKVRVFPTILVFSPKGEEKQRIEGFQNPAALGSMLLGG